MSTSSSAATAPMVVVVDVVDSSPAAAQGRRNGEATMERLEIDVDVTSRTTAEDLLADVEAALAEMECALCLPRKAAALAAGRVLPPLAAIELAMRSAMSDAVDTPTTGAGVLLAVRYASAFRHVKGANTVPKVRLRIGSDRVSPAPPDATGFSSPQKQQQHQQPPPVVWSVVPRDISESTESLAVVSVSTAATSAPSSRMLTRDETTPHTTAAADADAAVEVSSAAASVASGEGNRETATATCCNADDALHRTRGGTPLAAADALARTTPSTAENSSKVGSNVSGRVDNCAAHAFKSAGNAGDSRPLPLPTSSTPSTHTSANSTTSVVALEDVDVFAFRRLQAHRALILSRAEATHGTLSAPLLPGGAGGVVTSEERQRLQPTLPWVAVEAAIETEVRRLQAESVLMGFCAVTHHDTNAEGDAPCKPSSLPLLAATRARLRAAWLHAVKEEVAAYQAETKELRQAAEKAEVWRAAWKDTLRAETAALETEVAQRATRLAERDVLRRRVAQLEARAAIAKEEEKALLQSFKGVVEQSDGQPDQPQGLTAVSRGEAAAAPSNAAAENQPLVPTTAVVSSEATAVGPRRQLQSPSLPASLAGSFSSASSSETSSGSEPPPPPPPPATSTGCSAHSSAHALRPHGITAANCKTSKDGQRLHGQRWSGRRVPLTHSDTSAPPPPTAQLRSRSRLSIDRSFLSPSLQEEVRAALASDTEESEVSAAATSTSTTTSNANNEIRTSGVVRSSSAASPPYPPLQQQQPSAWSSRRRRYQRKDHSLNGMEGSAAVALSDTSMEARAFPASVTPLRAAPTTAFSPSPVVPGMYSEGEWLHGYDYRRNTAAGRPRPTSGGPIPSPALSHLHEGDQQSRPPSLTRHPASTSAVEELRHVTSALRRHICEPQPDPLEGQRLLQRVRELRRAIERRGDDDDEDACAAEARGEEQDDYDDDDEAAAAAEVRCVSSGGQQNRIATFADPQTSLCTVAAASASVTRDVDRQPFASPSLLYDSRAPNRRRGLYGY
jgi:hypothetical protein